MAPKKFATLKQTLLGATDFSEIVDYYFTEFGNDPTFARAGEPMYDKTFVKALAEVAVRALGGPAGAFEGMPYRIAEHRFVHGAFTLGKKWTAMMFYFEDVEQGFMALGDDGGPSHFTRFSFVKTPDGKRPKVH